MSQRYIYTVHWEYGECLEVFTTERAARDWIKATGLGDWLYKKTLNPKPGSVSSGKMIDITIVEGVQKNARAEVDSEPKE